MRETIWIGLGGAIGTMARYWVVVLAMPLSRTMPWSTVAINILGSFLIGLFGTLTLSHGRYAVPELGRLFFMVGICGGFTTFSSFSLQTLDLLRGGHVARALLNVAASVLLCLGAVALGHTIGARLNGGAVQVAQTMREEEAS